MRGTLARVPKLVQPNAESLMNLEKFANEKSQHVGRTG